MSTGQLRRCLLGRALMHDPDHMIFDEPTSGLDLSATYQYLDILRKLLGQEKTILLATHHIHEIPPEIERVILMRDGKIFADGCKTELLTDQYMSRLFDVPLRVVALAGFYQVLPA
jgi:iron complex transport system ATP-binding protein